MFWCLVNWCGWCIAKHQKAIAPFTRLHHINFKILINMFTLLKEICNELFVFCIFVILNATPLLRHQHDGVIEWGCLLVTYFFCMKLTRLSLWSPNIYGLHNIEFMLKRLWCVNPLHFLNILAVPIDKINHLWGEHLQGIFFKSLAMNYPPHFSSKQKKD